MRTRLQGPRFSCPQGSEFRGLLVSFGNPGGSAHHGPEGQSWKGKLAQPPEVEVWAEPTTLAAPEVLLRGLKAGAWGTHPGAPGIQRLNPVVEEHRTFLTPAPGLGPHLPHSLSLAALSFTNILTPAPSLSALSAPNKTNPLTLFVTKMFCYVFSHHPLENFLCTNIMLCALIGSPISPIQ